MRAKRKKHWRHKAPEEKKPFLDDLTKLALLAFTVEQIVNTAIIIWNKLH